MKYHEIAQKLGISVKTVETQMSRALQSLRKELRDFLVAIIIALLFS
jgi:RNA polymerase sigma-70 factor, ECF subfamily